MKIGVITWFKYENYGTVLQALAMQRFLKKNKYDTELVNLSLDDQLISNQSRRFKALIKEKLYNLKNKRLTIKLNRLKNKNKEIFQKKSEDFKNIIERNCKISREVNNEVDYKAVINRYDALVFGSDQIWNPNWYHPYYFCDFEEINLPRVAYAPSFGVTAISEEKKENVRRALSRFSSLSVRENGGKKIIKELLEEDVPVVVDPTFLLSKEEWACFEHKDKICFKNYLLCYFLGDNRNHWKAAKKYAEKNNLNIVIIPTTKHSYFREGNKVYDCNVEMFLSLVKNAKCIFTDSFHGSVFSLIYEKMFICFERHNPKKCDSQNSRLYNLGEMVNMENFVQKYNTSNVEKFDDIDYNDVIVRINNCIEKSKKYIIDALRMEVKNEKS